MSDIPDERTLSALQNLGLLLGRVRLEGGKVTGIVLGPRYAFMKDLTTFHGLPVGYDPKLVSDVLIGNFAKKVKELRKCTNY